MDFHVLSPEKGWVYTVTVTVQERVDFNDLWKSTFILERGMFLANVQKWVGIFHQSESRNGKGFSPFWAPFPEKGKYLKKKKSENSPKKG